MVHVTGYTPQDKSRIRVCFDNGTEFLLYRSEVRQMKLEAGGCISEEDYRVLVEELVGKRAKKRAMHLLEQMDRTERQLREKLAMYPQECVDRAVEYVSRFHYLDDYRYACNYIRCHKGRYSKRQMLAKLAVKGVGRDLASRALDEEYGEDESAQVRAILTKRRFAGACGEREFAKNYRYLVNRGFSGDVVLRIMREIG